MGGPVNSYDGTSQLSSQSQLPLTTVLVAFHDMTSGLSLKDNSTLMKGPVDSDYRVGGKRVYRLLPAGKWPLTVGQNPFTAGPAASLSWPSGIS